MHMQFKSTNLAKALAERCGDEGQISSMSKIMLGEYVTLLDSVTLPLSDNELKLVFDSLNGVIEYGETLNLTWAQIDDSCRLHGLDNKWGVDGPALVSKIRGFSRLELLKLWDETRKFWAIGSI